MAERGTNKSGRQKGISMKKEAKLHLATILKGKICFQEQLA